MHLIELLGMTEVKHEIRRETSVKLRLKTNRRAKPVDQKRTYIGFDRPIRS
jgi:hypothetical protein